MSNALTLYQRDRRPGAAYTIPLDLPYRLSNIRTNLLISQDWFAAGGLTSVFFSPGRLYKVQAKVFANKVALIMTRHSRRVED